MAANNNNNNIYKCVRSRESLLLTKTLLQWFMLLAAAVLLLSPDFIVALKDVSVTIPQAVKRGNNALLVCNYDMENDTLYSVKWYKGRREFYRYTPKENPAMKVFALTTGLNVERNLSNQSHVVLSAVPLNISGKFTCEISVEAPFFTTAMVSGEMEVVELPEQQASVTGIQPRYRIGDLVDGNCSIKYSKPAANLTWTINGIVVPPHHIKTYQIEKYEEHNLESVVSAINFMVTTQHFVKGQMKLKCTATIFNIYTEEIENIIEEDRPRIMASGRSYDINAYPYDQHASGDGFEDHNESYLTYYSANDGTSTAAPSARLALVTFSKRLRLYWKHVVTSVKDAVLLATSSSLLSTWPMQQQCLGQEALQEKPLPQFEQRHKIAEQQHPQQLTVALKATMLIISTFLMPATTTHGPVSPSSRHTSIQPIVERSRSAFIPKRTQLKGEIAHEMEINAISGARQSKDDNNSNADDVDNTDYFTKDGDGESSWRLAEEFISNRILIADVGIIEWSLILSLNCALMLRYRKPRARQHHRQRATEREEEQENHGTRQQQERQQTQCEQQLFQQQLKSLRSCQNKSPSILSAAYPWLFNDFLSPHQVGTLQHIKALKCFCNCQCSGEGDSGSGSGFRAVEWLLCLSKQSSIDTDPKFHLNLLCRTHQRKVTSTMLLLTTGQNNERDICSPQTTMATAAVGRMGNLKNSLAKNQLKSC